MLQPDWRKKQPPRSQWVCVHFLQRPEPGPFSLGNQLEVSRVRVIAAPYSPSVTLPGGGRRWRSPALPEAGQPKPVIQPLCSTSSSEEQVKAQARRHQQTNRSRVCPMAGAKGNRHLSRAETLPQAWERFHLQTSAEKGVDTSSEEEEGECLIPAFKAQLHLPRPPHINLTLPCSESASGEGSWHLWTSRNYPVMNTQA